MPLHSPASAAVPVNVVPPSIFGGTALPSQAVFCDFGEWTDFDFDFDFEDYQWSRDGVDIPGEDFDEYVVAPGDVGHAAAHGRAKEP